MRHSLRLAVVGLLTTVAAATLLPPSAQYDCSGISPTTNTTLDATIVVSGLSRPLFVTAPPGDTNRIFIVEKGGRIKIHKHGHPADTVVTFLDITAKVEDTFGESGLLGLAFDPDFATTRRFWVNYTELIEDKIYTVLARYTVSVGNPDLADPTEHRVLRIEQPGYEHHGGMIAFGPDGFLYVGRGDGGGSGDEHGVCGYGQNRSVLLGKLLRVDVRGIDPDGTPPDCGLDGAYTIPSTNPFSDGPGGMCDEIWAYGLRNPWRSSFDALTGDLYIGDVGQNCTEEIDFASSVSAGGENYGWRQMEGSYCFDVNDQFSCDPAGVICSGSPPCHDPGITLPVTEYSHASGGCSVTGGYVYRGCRMPNYRGRYFYGDFCTGKVGSFVTVGGVATDPIDMTAQFASHGGLASFGTDGQGEMYAVFLGGLIHKIVPPFVDLEVSGRGAGSTLRLSKTGSWTWENLFASSDVPLTFYRVYRGAVGGPYRCVLRSSAPSWPEGGDPDVPAVGELFTYVITAVRYGEETKPGTSGTFDATSCPTGRDLPIAPPP